MNRDLPANRSDGERTGARIGQYRLVRVISSGGMGTVYEARQEQPERTVAVKVMKQGVVSRSARRRFEYEAQILARLRHPGIAQVIEAGTYGGEGEAAAVDDAGEPYLVMEYIPDARSIADYAREKSLTLKKRLELFVQVCDAVQHGHQRGIIHRDLKPDNILVDSRGRVKIIDFGVARMTDPDAAPATMLTEAGQIIGTVQYMSPEQCEAGQNDVDVRSDVYTLGVVLYELLCEDLPYDVRKTTLFEAARLIREEPPKRLSTTKHMLRGDVEVIVLKALEKEPDLRYQTAAALSDDISRFLAGKVILAKPAGPGRKFWMWVKRNPTLSFAAGIAFLVVTGFIGYVLFWSYPQIKAEKEKVSQAYDRILRLSDVKDLADLEDEDEVLWPAFPENIAQMKSWIERAEALLSRVPLHRQILQSLRAKALPFDEKIELRVREELPSWRELLALKKARADIAARMQKLGEGADSAAHAEELEQELNLLEERLLALETEVFERPTSRFADMNTQWEHDTLADLVARLDSLSDREHGVLRRMRERMAFATTVEEKSITRHRADWDHAIASIADREENPQYNGLVIKEQMGLVPLGRNRDSGLWEFGHLQTGNLPKHGADGRLALTGETGLVFVLIPGGSFNMGSELPSKEKPLGSPNVDPGSWAIHLPVHTVNIERPFLLSKYEMTQAQWLRFTGENPSYWQKEQYRSTWNLKGDLFFLRFPVEMVSWEDCEDVLTKLGLRFPSEAEWEYAARAGTTTVFWPGNDPESRLGIININDPYYLKKTNRDRPYTSYEEWSNDWYGVPLPVGMHRPNPFGLYDVCFGRNEWCRDSFCFYKDAPVDGSAFESTNASTRVVRRGSSASRFQHPPGLRSTGISVRPAASLW